MENQMSSESKEREAKKFKFEGIRTYSSTEWLMDNRKKYRQVFDKREISFIYVELALENLEYGVQFWDAQVDLVCYWKRGGREIEFCKLNPEVKVAPDDRQVFIREGWGNHSKSI